MGGAGKAEAEVEAQDDTNHWDVITEVDLCDASQPSIQCQGTEVGRYTPRPATCAFTESEEEKAKEKQKAGGRKWFKFGMNLPSITGRGGGHEATMTVVSAFSDEQADDDDFLLPSPLG